MCVNTDSQENNYKGKVYGEPLLTHLYNSGREIAVPIQECVHMLLHTGMREEVRTGIINLLHGIHVNGILLIN
jgi:hypothetical protein